MPGLSTVNRRKRDHLLHDRSIPAVLEIRSNRRGLVSRHDRELAAHVADTTQRLSSEFQGVSSVPPESKGVDRTNIIEVADFRRVILERNPSEVGTANPCSFS